MSADHLAQRNRVNAQKSTGPKSAHGKAVVAGNAKKHGVTGRPDPDRLRAWLGVILGRAQIGPADLMPSDDYGLRALALAEAETRLVAVQEAMQALTQETVSTAPATMAALVADAEDVAALTHEMIAFTGDVKQGFRTNIRIVNDKRGARTVGMTPYENRIRIMTRYLAEAQARRRRAFAAWIAVQEEEAARQIAMNGAFPKQSQSMMRPGPAFPETKPEPQTPRIPKQSQTPQAAPKHKRGANTR
mgnify:CR=1 FL=1